MFMILRYMFWMTCLVMPAVVSATMMVISSLISIFVFNVTIFPTHIGMHAAMIIATIVGTAYALIIDMRYFPKVLS